MTICKLRLYLYAQVGASLVASFIAAPTAHAADESQTSMADWKASSVADATDPVPGPSPSAVVTKPVDTPSPSSGSGLRTAGIVTASAGLAAVVTGSIFNIKANGLAQEIGHSPGDSMSRDADRKTYQMLGVVGYGVGAACLATGTILYVLGRRSRATSSASLEVAPMIAQGQAGAFLQGTF